MVRYSRGRESGLKIRTGWVRIPRALPNEENIMICDYCKQDKPDVQEVINPYYEDVCGIVVINNLCDECYQTCIDDI